MVLPSNTIRAILDHWDAQSYDGSQDVRQWLGSIEGLCQMYGIPPVQMTEVAVKCTAGEVKSILEAMFEAKVAEAGMWLWAEFKECVIQIHGEHGQTTPATILGCTDQLWQITTGRT
jgi:hypothetical protein